MSVESEITRIENNVNESLAAVADAGVEVASDATSDDLPALISEIGATVVRVSSQSFTDAEKTQARTNIGAASSSHGHNAATTSAAGFMSADDKKKVDTVNVGITTAGTGAAYTATVPGITALSAGVHFIMIPHTASTQIVPTLNVNGLGAKNVRRPISGSTATTVATGSATNWLASGKPILMTYNGTYWIPDMYKPNANDIYGTVPLASGGTGATTAEAARTNLGISTENWTFTLEDGSTTTKAVYVG